MKEKDIATASRILESLSDIRTKREHLKSGVVGGAIRCHKDSHQMALSSVIRETAKRMLLEELDVKEAGNRRLAAQIGLELEPKG